MKSIRVKSYNKIIKEAIVNESEIKLDGDTGNFNGRLKKRIIDALRLAKECRAAAQKARENGDDENAEWLEQRAEDYEQAAQNWNQDIIDDEEEDTNSPADNTNKEEEEGAATSAQDAANAAARAAKSAEDAANEAQQAADDLKDKGQDNSAAQAAADKAKAKAEEAEQAAKEAQEHADAASQAEEAGDTETANKEAQAAKDAQGKAEQASQEANDAAEEATKEANKKSAGERAEEATDTAEKAAKAAQDKADTAQKAADDLAAEGKDNSEAQAKADEAKANADKAKQAAGEARKHAEAAKDAEQKGDTDAANSEADQAETAAKDAVDAAKGSSSSNDSSDSENDSDSDSESDSDSDSSSKSKGKGSSKNSSSDSGSDNDSDDTEEDDEDDNSDSDNQSDDQPINDPFADDEDIPSLPQSGQPGQQPRDPTVDEIIKQLSKLDGEAKHGAIDGLTDLINKKNESLNEAFHKGIREFSDEEWDDLNDETIEHIMKAKKIDTVDTTPVKAKLKSWSDNKIARQELEDEENQNIQHDVLQRRAKEKELDKYSSVETIHDFEIDFENCIRDQVELVMQEYQSYDEINPEYEDEDIIMKADVSKMLPSEVIPTVAVFYDKSGSCSSFIPQCNKAIATVKTKYVDTGLCKLDLYYFGDRVVPADSGRYTGGSTEAWPDIIDHIKKGDYKNVIIMSDSDIGDQNNHGESWTVEGCVWWIWRDGIRADRCTKELKGMQHNFECEIH